MIICLYYRAVWNQSHIGRVSIGGGCTNTKQKKKYNVRKWRSSAASLSILRLSQVKVFEQSLIYLTVIENIY